MASTYTVVDGTDFVKRVTPRNDQVLIKRIKDEKTKGGILLPGNYKTNDVPSERGEVIAVGPGWLHSSGKYIEMDMKPNDEVMFHAFPSGVEVKQGADEYLLISEKQVVCVLKGK